VQQDDRAGFVPRTQVMTPDDVGRAIRRIGHEIVEHHRSVDTVVLVGLQRGGVWVADAIAEVLDPVPVGALDVAMYRDDIGLRPVTPHAPTRIPVALDGRDVVLVDDVLYTGRTIRAALDALADHGRPRTVQLAVIVDRGHRELPIRPDYVGKNLPTNRDELVDVSAEHGVRIGSATS
jgi:pyrimidine operon attenuation protein / uracil phosphoribosyltransferase